MFLLHILSGARLEAFLAFVVILSICYSESLRDVMRRIAFLKPLAQKKDAERFELLKGLDNNSYRLLLALVFQVTRDLVRWSLVSIAGLTLYGVADFFQLPLLQDRRVSVLTVLFIFACPFFGMLLSFLWARQLVVDLREFAAARKAVTDEQLRLTPSPGMPAKTHSSESDRGDIF